MPLGEDDLAVVDYVEKDGVLHLTHTGVPSAWEGKGIGSKLVTGVFDLLRASGRKAFPVCPFIVAVARRKPEYADVIAG
ncbi:MAG: GNAT family N-acetyltransferase [Sphingomonadaceae bacterium]